MGLTPGLDYQINQIIRFSRIFRIIYKGVNWNVFVHQRLSIITTLNSDGTYRGYKKLDCLSNMI